jgi:hypothetical protein
MQSVSADLTAAILAQERRPLVRLRVDWARNGNYTDTYDDLSADVVSVDTNCDLTTDLPPQAKLFSGSAAAEATVTLGHRDPAGDPAKHAAWHYSPLNTASPLFGVRRKGAPALLEFGFNGASGPEYVTVLTGSVRSLQVLSGGRVAVMRIADRSETMRKQVTLPMVIADGQTESGILIRPGLRTTFLADWVARKCGYYASPPPRTGCKFLATHHGSGYPEVGTIREHHGQFGSELGFVPTAIDPTTPKFVTAIHTAGAAGGAEDVTYLLGGTGTISCNNTRTMLWEGWRKFDRVDIDQPLFLVFKGGSGAEWISGWWQESTGQFKLSFNRGGTDPTNRTATGPTVSPGTTGWHYFGVHVAFNSTGVDVTFRYDAATTGPVSVATPSVTNSPALDTIAAFQGKVSSYVDAWYDGYAEADQLTTEATVGTWNNGFVPTADIRASASVDTKIVATPPATEQGWTLFQQIAAAEFATAGFTEPGMLSYWPRTRWTSPPYTTSQRTLSAASSVKELETVEAIDQVRNRIIIRAQIPETLASGDVWRLATAVRILGSGATKTIIAELDRPATNIDTTFVSSVTGADGSRYAAGTEKDGSGLQISNLTIVATVLGPTTVKLAITNPGANGWLTCDANLSAPLAGKPYLVIEGQPVEFNQDVVSSKTRTDVTNATSISNYGEQMLELEDNPFRQDLDMVEGVAVDLAADLADPGPAMSDVPIVADPRLQLGDRVQVVDLEGLAFTAEFHLSRIQTTFDGEGLSQTIGLRSA